MLKKYLHETQLKALLWETLKKEIALAVDMEKLLHQYETSRKTKNNFETLEREAASAKQALDRAKLLHDSLYQNYIDHLMSEREYMDMKQKYKADMEDAQTRLEAVEQQRNKECRNTEKNPWLTSCLRFREETELTEEMAHALIERVEVSANNHISIVLRFCDEFNTLAKILYKSEAGMPV